MPWTTPRTWVTNELVTAALLNEQLRDNLSFLFAPNYQEAVGSGTDFTTTSTTNVDVTGMSVSITTTGGNLLVAAFGRFFNSSPSSFATLVLNVDGTDYDINENQGIGYPASVCVFRRFVVSAGSHTVKLRLRANANTAFFSGGTNRRLIAVEGVV